MITLRELVEQQRGRLPKEEEQEVCLVEENEDIDAELSHEELTEIQVAVSEELGEVWNPLYHGKYHSGTMQKARIPKYGPGKVRKNGECLY
jgi:hypothetical protein